MACARIGTLLLALTAVMALSALDAEASKFYKCRQADGTTTMTQFPCAAPGRDDSVALGQGQAAYARSAIVAAKPSAAEATTPVEASRTAAQEGEVLEIIEDDLVPVGTGQSEAPNAKD